MRDFQLKKWGFRSGLMALNFYGGKGTGFLTQADAASCTPRELNRNIF
jgi:hypothetical protein